MEIVNIHEAKTHLSRLLDRADGPRVTVGWLMEQLGERSFGLTLFILALLAFVPGVASVTGILIAWPAVQMMLGHDAAALPGFVARRRIGMDRLDRAIRFAVPRLEWVERLIRPRWATPFQSTKRLTGAVMLALGLTMLSPVPLGQLFPALVAMLLALAYLERDGVALTVALVAAFVSIAVTKMAAASAFVAGTLLNGRVRSAVHCPESTSRSRMLAASRPRAVSASIGSTLTLSSPSRSITTDCRTRFAPRLIAETRPQPGDVYTTPSVFLSLNRSWPVTTRSPSATSMVGFMPG